MAISRRRVAGCVAIITAVVVGLAAPLAVSTDPGRSRGAGLQGAHLDRSQGDVHRVRWNPCQTITFAVNPRLAGKSERATRQGHRRCA